MCCLGCFFILLFNFQTIVLLFLAFVCFTLIDSGHLKLWCLFISFHVGFSLLVYQHLSFILVGVVVLI